ncbi:mRNA triphosphatase CET1 [Ceraceosorus guamensis]|uniref:mRNA-capping enzyme subunit beta n=1 Tax=Ceraceosorus guamensis TaxID=1522189 RepID=A0A316W7J9_9BASI|nr:mRNA triphosphatase CET1 [Ceraceosorus guamensis]PWN44053.1 mRNA triphosphatase CET1 [Ceraceosorus guamensis]
MPTVFPDPPIDRSIFGWDPKDEFAGIVSDWIWNIEAKVGIILDNEGMRLNLPVANETIVHMQPGWRFQSNMTQEQHKSLNTTLNALVPKRMIYSRLREHDSLHANRVRVTREHGSKEIKSGPGGIIRKERVADMNVFCPNHNLDYRISLNWELPIQSPPQDQPQLTRDKNRLCYQNPHFQVDLTAVDSSDNPGVPSHELELEFRDAGSLLREAHNYRSEVSPNRTSPEEWTPYEDLILVFLNSVRMIIR